MRRRPQGDRRGFAFFYPQLPEAPLIFVEVALVSAVPRSIAHLIGGIPTDRDSKRPHMAAFYSISNCEPVSREFPSAIS